MQSPLLPCISPDSLTHPQTVAEVAGKDYCGQGKEYSDSSSPQLLSVPAGISHSQHGQGKDSQVKETGIDHIVEAKSSESGFFFGCVFLPVNTNGNKHQHGKGNPAEFCADMDKYVVDVPGIKIFTAIIEVEKPPDRKSVV